VKGNIQESAKVDGVEIRRFAVNFALEKVCEHFTWRAGLRKRFSYWKLMDFNTLIEIIFVVGWDNALETGAPYHRYRELCEIDDEATHFDREGVEKRIQAGFDVCLLPHPRRRRIYNGPLWSRRPKVSFARIRGGPKKDDHNDIEGFYIAGQ
jgi:hypothetical protein